MLKLPVKSPIVNGDMDLSEYAKKSDVDAIGASIDNKADKKEVEELSLQLDNSNAEVAAARNGFETLGKRLDGVDSQLEHKANKSTAENIQVQLNNLVLEAGKEEPTVVELAQARGKYALLNDRLDANDDVVNLLNSDFFEEIKWEVGTIGANGKDSPNSARIRNIGYIKVNKGSKLSSNKNFIRIGVAVYNENLVQIENTSLQLYDEYVVPFDCYIRIFASYKDMTTTISDVNEISQYISLRKVSIIKDLEKSIANISISASLIADDDWELGTIDNKGFSQVEYRIRTRNIYNVNSNCKIHFNRAYNQNLRYQIIYYDDNLNQISNTNYLYNEVFSFDGNYNIRIVVGDIGSYDKIDNIKNISDSLKLSSSNADDNILIRKYSKNSIAKNALFSQDINGFWNFVSSADLGVSIACDFCFVNNEIWIFSANADDTHTEFTGYYRFKYNETDNTFTHLYNGTHNLGHVNSIEYCSETDCMILGNGSGSYTLDGEIYIIPNVSTFENNKKIDVNSNDVIRIDCSSYDLGKKFNVVWGDSNLGRFDIAYLVTDDNANIRKLLLGKGSNVFENGQFISGKSDYEFNGTFKVLEHYKQHDCGYETCVQGLVYNKGKLYSGIGHGTGGARIWEMELCSDGTIKRKCYTDKIYNEFGENIDDCIGGLTINNNKLFVSIQRKICVYDI